MERVLAIAADRRVKYATHQPRFWRPAPDATNRQREHFGALLGDPDTLFLVAEFENVVGFVVARIVDAPPVYDPGGPTCLVDDFAVHRVEEWAHVGPLLLDEVRREAGRRGAVQLVVVTASADEAKRAVLRSTRLTPASEWWVGPL